MASAEKSERKEGLTDNEHSESGTLVSDVMILTFNKVYMGHWRILSRVT